jgi:hypothetical protein
MNSAFYSELGAVTLQKPAESGIFNGIGVLKHTAVAGMLPHGTERCDKHACYPAPKE